MHIPPAAALKCSQFFGLCACRRQRSEDSDRQARGPLKKKKKNKRQPSASSAVPEFALLDRNFEVPAVNFLGCRYFSGKNNRFSIVSFIILNGYVSFKSISML